MRLDRAHDRRVGNFQDTVEVDAGWIEPGAEVAILVIGEALPVGFGHVADRDRLVVGVGHVVADFDGGLGVVDVAEAIEARVERADERPGIVVNGSRQPALARIAQFLPHGPVADVAPDRRHDVDQQDSEDHVADAEGDQMAQRAELGAKNRRPGEHAQ